MKVVQKVILSSHHNHKKMLGDLRFRPTGLPKPIILFIHGFKGFKDWGTFNIIAQQFAENEFVYCKFNLSHNGTTLKQPREIDDIETFGQNNFSIELDVLGVIIDYIKSDEFIIPESETSKSNIYLIGHSRGGGLAILKANEDPRIKGIVTWAAINNLAKRWPEEILKQWKKDGVMYVLNSRTNQNLPVYYQMVIDFEKNAERLDIPKAASHLHCPWLIAHGSNDETLPFQMATDLKSRNEKAELYIINEAGHTFGGSHPHETIELRKHTQLLVDKTISFLKNI